MLFVAGYLALTRAPAPAEYAWVIDSSGHTRDILDTDPGPATSATESSFSVMLSATVEDVLRQK